MADDPSDGEEESRGDVGDRTGAASDREGWSFPADETDSVGPNGRPVRDLPDPRSGPVAAIRWVLRTDSGPVVFVREIVGSAFAVLAIGLLLFAVSGVWPPMVAVESGSMQPHLQKGDLVFVMEQHRLAPDYATGDTGVVTYAAGAQHDYKTFGEYGNVIIYHPYGDTNRKPVIHRARFWVNKGENWLPKANPEYVSGTSCQAVPNCPAPHAGFITKGDNERTNDYYDQTRGISDPVKPQWIAGTAKVRIPWLGWVRLTFSNVRTGHGPSAMASVPW